MCPRADGPGSSMLFQELLFPELWSPPTFSMPPPHAHPEGAVCDAQIVWTRGRQQRCTHRPSGPFLLHPCGFHCPPGEATRCKTLPLRSTQPPPAGGAREGARNTFSLQQQRDRTAPGPALGGCAPAEPRRQPPLPARQCESPPARGSQAFVRLPRPGSASDKSPSLMRGCQRSAGSGFLTPAQPDTAGDE